MAKQYRVISGMFKDHLFHGTPIKINGEDRIWDDDSDGNSYPAVNCDLLPDLARTVKALEEYDVFDKEFCAMDRDDDLVAALEKLDRLGEAVGIAFGLDTADRNSMDTCKNHIRPGPATPAPGCELSFVRRMAKLYLEEKGKTPK
jgi:hypothetical protein